MKKVFVLSLLLMSIFFIGNVAVASAIEENCRFYNATVTSDCLGSWEDCIEVCLYEDGWAEAWTCYYYDWLIFTLEDLGTDAKNLVGFSDNWPKVCHVYLRGRILESDCYLDMFGGCRIHAKGERTSYCECDGNFK